MPFEVLFIIMIAASHLQPFFQRPLLLFALFALLFPRSLLFVFNDLINNIKLNVVK